MTDKEKILAEIERRMKNNHQDATESGAGAFYEDRELLSFINSLSAEHPSEELEEEINDYFERHFEICNDNTIKCGGEEFGTYELLDVIEHFTNWQKEQMMKSAIEVKINRDTLYNLKPIIHKKYQDLKIGDKILIIKEGEK